MKKLLGNLQIALLLLCLGEGTTLAQTVSSFNKIYGKAGSAAGKTDGDIIYISGSGFVSTTKVYFNGHLSASNYLAASTQINSWVPYGATTGQITVSNSLATPWITSSNFTVISNAPYILSYTASARFKENVTITGGNFGASDTVYFGGVGAAATTADLTKLTVAVPVGAVTGKIGVYNPTTGLTGNSAGIFYTEPSFTSYSPTSAPVSTKITVTGTNFLGMSSPVFNNVPVSTWTYIDNNHFSFLIPAGANDGTMTIATPALATFLLPPKLYVLPTITDFNPKIGVVGTKVTITGDNFLDVKTVAFNNGQTNVTPTATQIVCGVPTNATSGSIILITPYGSITSSACFYLPPNITGISPSFGGHGTVVTITGSGFTNVSSVKFNGLNAESYSATNFYKFTAVVPDRATVGPISVTTPGGTTTYNQTFAAPPVIDSFSPTSGYPRTVVQITGIGFTNYNTLSFNGVVATYTNNSSTQITALVPTNATSGFITFSRNWPPVVTGTSSVPFQVGILKLAIEKVNADSVAVKWPASANAFYLQYATNLLNANTFWISNTVVPVLVDTTNKVTFPRTNAPRYYRLIAP